MCAPHFAGRIEEFEMLHHVASVSRLLGRSRSPEMIRTPCVIDRGEELKAQEASFREAREKMLENLERCVKQAKAAMTKASAGLKKEQRTSQVNNRHHRRHYLLSKIETNSFVSFIRSR